MVEFLTLFLAGMLGGFTMFVLIVLVLWRALFNNLPKNWDKEEDGKK